MDYLIVYMAKEKQANLFIPRKQLIYSFFVGMASFSASLLYKLSVRERTGRHAERGGKDGWRGWFEPGWVPQRLRVPLSTLMDEKGALARGCVLLGFLPDGNHLCTYA